MRHEMMTRRDSRHRRGLIDRARRHFRHIAVDRLVLLALRSWIGSLALADAHGSARARSFARVGRTVLALAAPPRRVAGRAGPPSGPRIVSRPGNRARVGHPPALGTRLVDPAAVAPLRAGRARPRCRSPRSAASARSRRGPRRARASSVPRRGRFAASRARCRFRPGALPRRSPARTASPSTSSSVPTASRRRSGSRPGGSRA